MFPYFTIEYNLNAVIILIIALCVNQDHAGVVSRSFKAEQFLAENNVLNNQIDSISDAQNVFMAELERKKNNETVANSENSSNSVEITGTNINETTTNTSKSVQSAEPENPNVQETASNSTNSTGLTEQNDSSSSNSSNSSNSTQNEKPNSNLIKKNAIKSSLLSQSNKQKEESKSEANELKKQFQVNKKRCTGESTVHVEERRIQPRAKVMFDVSILESLNKRPSKDFYLPVTISENVDSFIDSEEKISDEKISVNSKPQIISSELNKEYFEEKNSQIEETDIYQDIIDENELEHINLTNTFILPVNVVDFVEEEELVNFSPNAVMSNIENINSNLLEIKPSIKNEIESNNNQIDSSNHREILAIASEAEDKTSIKFTENNNFGGFGVQLPENTKDSNINFLVPIPQEDKDLFGIEKQNSSFLLKKETIEEIINDSHPSQAADDSAIGIESAVTSGIDFLMNNEIAKNAAAAIEIFNFSDPSLSDHVIENSEIPSFVDLTKLSLKESSSSNETEFQAPAFPLSDLTNNSNASLPSKIGPKNTHVQIKPFLSILKNTVGVDVNVNVTSLTSTKKECPLPGVCLFWFTSHDQCNNDSECPSKMRCCKIRCTNECIEV